MLKMPFFLVNKIIFFEFMQSKTCQSNSLETGCTSCDDEYMFYSPPEGRCLKCDPGYVLDSSLVCIPCYEACLTCLSTDIYNCLSC